MNKIMLFVSFSFLVASCNAQQVVVFNKTQQPIWISLLDENGLLLMQKVAVTETDPEQDDYVEMYGNQSVFKVGSKASIHNRLRFTMKDMRRPFRMALWTTNPGNNVQEKIIPRSDKPIKTLNPLPYKVYAFTPGKKIFVVWERGSLKPQEKSGGIIGNLYFANSIDLRDIKEMTEGLRA